MDNIDLSIIVPVFNVEGYLKRALDSILLQLSSITYEILLIDDGSSDKVVQFVMSIKVIFRMFLLVTLKITEWQKLGI